jgi:hypothetical protein
VGPGHADVLRHHRAEGVGFEPTRSCELLAVFKSGTGTSPTNTDQSFSQVKAGVDQTADYPQ